MADLRSEEEKEDDWKLGLIMFSTAGIFFLALCLNGTPLGFVDDLLMLFCKGAFWPMFVFAISVDFYDQYKEAKLNNTWSRPKQND